MSLWLLCEDTARKMLEMRRLGARPSPEQIAAFAEQSAPVAREGELPRNMRLAGNVAEIRVQGVLTKAPDIFAYFFGGGNTTYRSIAAGLAIAKSDPAIRSVVLHIDSPGGDVDGLFDLLGTIQSFRSSEKALSVRAENALSAAYGIAAVAGRIDATSTGSRFGSVGVAARYFVMEEIVDITNTDSPDKRPNVATDEGKAVVRRELDAIHELFIEAFADGRGTTLDDVRENFGRGATFLAGDAKKRKMIDSIAKPALRAVVSPAAAAAAGAQEGDQKAMDIKTLKASHPDIYEAAVQDGVKLERDRVTAHLTLGEMAGDEGMKLALENIEKGADCTHSVNAKYTALAMKRSERGTRQRETDEAGKAADGADQQTAAGNTEPAAKDEGDLAVEAMRKRGWKGGEKKEANSASR